LFDCKMNACIIQIIVRLLLPTRMLQNAICSIVSDPEHIDANCVKGFLSGVARFFFVKNTKTGKIYQISTNYTKCTWNITKDRRSVHKICQHLPLQDPPKFTQSWIFGLKTNHLATPTQQSHIGQTDWPTVFSNCFALYTRLWRWLTPGSLRLCHTV
jgi:hypothetical protein